MNDYTMVLKNGKIYRNDINNPLDFKENDGGRGKHFKGDAGDCVVRAIAITSGLPYLQIYNDLKEKNEIYADTHRTRVARRIKKKGSTSRDGNFRDVYHDYILGLGFTWTPTMKIGSGCTTHLRKGELPKGKLIARVSKHLCAVVDGVINDTCNPAREGNRCVYGYYKKISL